MSKAESTKTKLLDAARELFWTRGYSNVSVRDITKHAGVDVALVSRYFGSKEGLFEATLPDANSWEALRADPDDVLAAAVESFSHPFDPETDQANPFTMMIANVIDPQMGDRMRAVVQQHMADPIAEKLGGPDADERAATLLAALFGMALMRKNFLLDVLASGSSDDIRRLTQRLAEAAVRTDET